MARTYSYDPSKLGENGIDRMRMELGDTVFNPGELTAALCDEEYLAILELNPKWKKAKVKCLEAILMKFSHQVNTSVDGISYSFAERVKLWQELYKEAKAEASTAVPTADPLALNGSIGGGPYFYNDMHANPRKYTHPADPKERRDF